MSSNLPIAPKIPPSHQMYWLAIARSKKISEEKDNLPQSGNNVTIIKDNMLMQNNEVVIIDTTDMSIEDQGVSVSVAPDVTDVPTKDVSTKMTAVMSLKKSELEAMIKNHVKSMFNQNIDVTFVKIEKNTATVHVELKE